MRVVEVMTTDVESAAPEWSLKQAARVMIEAGVSGLPVVAETTEGALRRPPFPHLVSDLFASASS